MNRNVNSAFAYNPTNVDISRSKFACDHSYKTTFNVGDIIPFEVTEVLPGDTWQYKTSKVVRMQSLITPMMDNIYLDTYYFFVPNRLVWSHWKEFMGENTASHWIPTTTYTLPQITSPVSTGWNIGTVADYMGVPTGIAGLSVNALPFRAYAMICNEFFRSENVQDYLFIPTGDTTQTGSNGGSFVNDLANGGKPYTACKFFDVFTGCLPYPQKGPDVSIAGLNMTLPSLGVRTFDGENQFDFFPLTAKYATTDSTRDTWRLQKYNTYAKFGNSNPETAAGGNYFGTNTFSLHDSSTPQFFDDKTWHENFGLITKMGAQSNPSDNEVTFFAPYNLQTIPTTVSSSGTTINQLRLAFQIQKLYEKDARGGTRYIEILKSHFGVTSPDYRLQRPEYLGGNRIGLNVQAVSQTSATVSGQTPQGNQAAYSVTTDEHGEFIKSFTEHGFIIGVMVARYKHSYQQGLEKMWKRSDRLDYYFPVFANIGEQAVKNSEIYAQGNSTYDDAVFGYQEAWYDYRYKPDKVTGEMRSSATTSLDIWHLADDYNALPTLSDTWLVEDKSNVDRVLAVTSSVSNQIFADLYINAVATRPMPVYSIPGLIDHH